MGPSPQDRIALYPHSRPIRVWAGEFPVADSKEALLLKEAGYPDVLYIPRKDVVMACLRRSPTITHCPFKGQATYYSIETSEGTWQDAAWSYEAPLEGVKPIAGHIAFDAQIVAVQTDNETSPNE